MRRISALAVLVVLLTGWGLPAQARTDRLSVDSYDIGATVDQDPRYPVMCDGANFLACGTVTVEVTLSGLDGRSRPAPETFPPVLNAGGTAEIARTYGCADATGRRVRRYDRTVVEDVTLNTRRGQPFNPPATDTMTVDVYAFLLDAQPGGCPVAMEPRLYRLVAKQVRFELESRWASIPSATYRLRGRGAWKGDVPTPALAG